jgi:large subunit ribosomal protein L28
MAKRCEVCDKGPVVGRTISHAHNVRPRRFEPNLQTVRAMVNGGGAAASARAACGRARSSRPPSSASRAEAVATDRARKP